MAVQEKLYTAREFWEIAQHPDNADKRLALINGVMVEMLPSSQKNTVIAMRIGHFINAHVIPRDLGYVTGPDGGFTLDEHNARQPDVAFISKERHPVLEGVEFPVAPDLAVEVISPSESSTDVLNKVRAYIRAGTRLVWTAYADEEMVYIWRPAPDGSLNVQAVDIDGTLDGGDVLPGFTLKVRDIFPK
ncbi:MAG TPA: Uma2 family endonuclease [Spirillospora sp.]|nr:Uma2 family endonuclease [Spirillospora sp.]